jgi:phenylacetate-CoA ligase
MGIEASAKRSFASNLVCAPDYVKRCAKALSEALDSTPAYESWRALDPGAATDVFCRYAALPAITKRELRAFGPQGFVPHGRDIEKALGAREIELVKTSGLTGDQVTNVWYQRWWNESEAASWKLNAHTRAAAMGEHREAILTSPWCTGFPCEDDYLSRHERTLGRFLYLSERSDPSEWSEELMNRMADEINAFEPVVIEANPSFLARLSRHIIAWGLKVHAPRTIILTYENPSILHRRQIARAFGAPIASSYGATETGYVFMECEAGRLHQVTESCHVDFLPFAPKHGGPELGRILVTTFGNPWRSLVRFDVGDVARLAGESPCACGRREGLTLASIEGRTVSLTLATDGRAVTQGAVDRALADVSGLLEYQLFQTGASAYHLRFVADEVEPEAIGAAALEALAALYGPEASIMAEPVRAVTPDPPGKYLLARRLEPIDPDTLLDAAYAPRAH